MNISDWYERVNERWPAEVPPLTPEEAVKAAKSLYLCAIGKRFTGTVSVTSGNRYTWIRGSEMVVNPDKKETIGGGWAALVHDLSHYAHRKFNPTIKPHSKEHARLELKMVNHVIKSGWLDGKLKPKKKVKVEPTKGEERLVKYQRVLDSIKRWEAKAKRAETYLKKLNRTKRALERHL
jgi:hypothetical protein